MALAKSETYSRATKLVLLMMVLFVVGVALRDDPVPAPKVEDAVAVETPEQKAAREAKEASDKAKKEREALQYLVASSSAKAIKSAMRDPDSLVFESLRVSDDAGTVCAEYRARNGFGGMNKEFAVVAGGKALQTPKAWNKHCTGPMRDMMFVTRRL